MDTLKDKMELKLLEEKKLHGLIIDNEIIIIGGGIVGCYS